MMRGRPSCLLQSAGGEANRILLASALSSMRIICPNRVSRRDWIIAVSLGCFVSLRTSSFRTNWYHLMPSSVRRHHWSSASILRASVLDIAQQSEPYRNQYSCMVRYTCCTASTSKCTSYLTFSLFQSWMILNVRKSLYEFLSWDTFVKCCVCFSCIKADSWNIRMIFKAHWSLSKVAIGRIWFTINVVTNQLSLCFDVLVCTECTHCTALYCTVAEVFFQEQNSEAN